MEQHQEKSLVLIGDTHFLIGNFSIQDHTSKQFIRFLDFLYSDQLLNQSVRLFYLPLFFFPLGHHEDPPNSNYILSMSLFPN